MVDAHVAVEHLVASVEIDVGHAQVVEALSAVAPVVFVVRAEVPPLLQLPVLEVVRREARARIVAAAHHGAYAASVESPDRAEEPERLVARVARAPELLHRVVVAPLDRLRVLKDGRPVRNSVERGACPPREARHVVWREDDVVVLGTPVLEPRALREGAAGKHASLTVHSAVRSPADHLRRSVAVEVRHHDGHVVRARADVRTEVDLPERPAGPVELHPLEPGLARLPALRVVASVRRPPDDHKLVLPVAVEVSY